MPYDNEKIYSFYCARYENISYKEYLKLGYEEFSMKISSVPETEPLFKILRSRAIDLSKIKDKEERRYWRELKKVNKIPDIYLSINEIERELKKQIGGFKDVK